MMTDSDHQWLCLGGPIHGQYRPTGLEMVVTEPAGSLSYRTGFGRTNRTVVIPHETILYRPTLMSLPGWRIKLPVWCEDRLARGKCAPDLASVLPGGLHGVPRDAALVCRWCYGAPMAGQDTCSRSQCITAWDAVRALDTMTWRGESE